MLEPLRCPSCSTRFGLSASRVHAGIRRAKCFRCDAIFNIEEVVGRLLMFAPLPAAEVAAAPAPEPVPEPPPSLTLGDLEGAEEEMLEATLIIPPPQPAATEPAAPEPAAPEQAAPEQAAPEQAAPEQAAPEQAAPQAAANPEDFEFFDPSEGPAPAGGASYSSARDAIEKLMGAAPSVPSQPQYLGTRNSMDVEATLSALDETLGGAAPAREPAPAPEPPPVSSMSSSSTMKLSSREIMAAIQAMPPPPPPAPVPARTEFLPRVEAPAAFPDPAAGQDQTLLKVQLEQETCNNLTLEQMTAWIEQGRVHEYHMVARQFSDNWIEAVKVPSLRPVFDRRRKRTSPSEELPVPPADIIPPKKSLFGGFFGRN